MGNSAERVLDAAKRAAMAAGEIISMSSDHQSPLIMKDGRDFATQADLDAEHAAMAVLEGFDPSIPVLGEEFGNAATIGADEFWVVDPIDGTLNFASGLPLCAASVALVRGGTALAAAIVSPRLGETYFAAKGLGAFVETAAGIRRLSVSAEGPESVLLGCGHPYATTPGGVVGDFYGPAARKFRNMVCLGAASISFCWVASGRLGACTFKTNNPWDMQPGKIIVEEAGGVVVDWEGNPLSLTSPAVLAGTSRTIEAFFNR